jgi:hypothetical protein
MGKMPLGHEITGNWSKSALLEAKAEFRNLLVGEGEEDALEEDHGLPQASVDVVVRRIEEFPLALRVKGSGVTEVGSSCRKGLVEVLDKFD